MRETKVSVFGREFCVPEARSFWTRLTGLTFKKDFSGMYFPKCSAVHTFFMRAPLDVVFFDKDSRPVRVFKNVPKNKVLIVRGARSVLELKGGTLGD